MSKPSNIDRLIELGLNRYRAGDLDGALLFWEEALATDPDNAQASSYVDYVREHYDVLASGKLSVDVAAQAPFAIEEEPEYQIEIIPEPAADPPSLESVTLSQEAYLMSLDVDLGWEAQDGDTSAIPVGAPTGSDELAEPPSRDEPHASLDLEADAPPAPLELEADEPPASLELEADAPPASLELEADAPPASLELEADAPEEPTRELVNFEDATREYHGVAQKFSQPIAPAPDDFESAESTIDSAANEFSEAEFTDGFNSSPGTPIGFASQETEVRKRDLGFVQPTRAAGAERAVESGEILLPEGPTVERHPPRLDPTALSQAEVMLPHAPTRELTPAELPASAQQPHIATAPTYELPAELRAIALEPVLSAPTRELGLRPGGKSLANPADDDAPTGQSDVRAIRAAAARGDGRVESTRSDGTHHDSVLPFDPMAAQAAEILEHVDLGAPADEAPDDRTRRRVTRSLELAAEWSEAGELDLAVAAVDLALSEDPNSALGQKLITRNKDTIMSLFQAYLGDLERMPQLAKPLHELSNAPISPRAAFLLSRIDGTLTIDELLDISGMPRIEAFRHICQLYLRGILR